MKIRELQEKNSNDHKKFREEIVKYENKIKSVKAECDKFKDSLRNLIVEFIFQTSHHQDEHVVFSKKWKEEKLGLTLTNELLFKLE